MRLAKCQTALRAVQAMSSGSVKTRRAPSRHCRDARVYGRTATVMHDIEYISPTDYTPLRATLHNIYGVRTNILAGALNIVAKAPRGVDNRSLRYAYLLVYCFFRCLHNDLLTPTLCKGGESPAHVSRSGSGLGSFLDGG